jgi:enoyl-CoA hydratase
VVRKPLIAAVEGWALGGGFELALACDLIVAAENARFGFPEVTRGLVPSEGSLIRLPHRLPYHVALRVLLTGEQCLNDGDAFERQDELISGLPSSQDAHEGARAFVEKRTPVWYGR